MSAALLRRTIVVTLLAVACAVTPCRALNIVATYDSSITNHPQASTIMNTINTTVARYNAKIADNMTVNITFKRKYTGLGESFKQLWRCSYAGWLAAVRNRASSLDDAVALGHLPDGPGNPVDGTPYVWMCEVLARQLGLSQVAPEGAPPAVMSVVSVMRAARGAAGGAGDAPLSRVQQAVAPTQTSAAPDGTIQINLDNTTLAVGPPAPDKCSLEVVAEHEIDEVLGSSSNMTGLQNGDPIPSGTVHIEDLFRYKFNGARSATTSAADSSWFSLDGTNLLARFNQNASGDFSDWWSPSPHPIVRVQDASGTNGSYPAMGVEWTMLDVLGWSYGPYAVWVDFNYGGLYFGLYDQPYNTLAAAVNAAPSGGLILIKGNGTSTEKPNLTKPLTITTVAGPVTIGL